MYIGGAFLNPINILINTSVASWAKLCCDYVEQGFLADALQTTDGPQKCTMIQALDSNKC